MEKPIIKKKTKALVVGSGAAGLNAVDELLKMGVDTLLVTDRLGGGTSFNAGSDKQTYYKLSMAGEKPDSVDMLARKFQSGGGMRGCHARALAALSAKSFIKLALLGVPFPQNEYGEYVGYQTDHDESLRATSAGPLTSKLMGECLLRSVKARNAEIIEGANLISIHTKDGNAVSALFDMPDKYLMVDFGAMLIATGGPSRVYYNRVFPDAQNGATGAALRAGVWANNLCYWQYGLASTKVKWNVSGSYQQAVPEYIDQNGEPVFADMKNRLDMVFLKGYQWPFDSAKAEGSSAVDRAVKEIYDKGGEVYLDYTRDPLSAGFDRIGDEARKYLKNCDALIPGAFERLRGINQKAVDFYYSHGIDLGREPLRIALCAQHSNGGLYVDGNWQTNIGNLYAAGECAGVFGAYRPGGSALNETQVGSLRAAQAIAAGNVSPIDIDISVFDSDITLSMIESDERETALWQKRMDECAGAVRSINGMKAMRDDIDRRLKERCGLELMNILTVQRFALNSMLTQACYKGNAGHMTDAEPDLDEAAAYAFVTDVQGTRAEIVEPVPAGEQWFEKVWKRSMRT